MKSYYNSIRKREVMIVRGSLEILSRISGGFIGAGPYLTYSPKSQ